jgi:hypothetical protein
VGDRRVKRPVLRLYVPLLGYAIGVLTALAGVFLLWGLAVALIVCGVTVAASFVLAFAGDGKAGPR